MELKHAFHTTYDETIFLRQVMHRGKWVLDSRRSFGIQRLALIIRSDERCRYDNAFGTSPCKLAAITKSVLDYGRRDSCGWPSSSVLTKIGRSRDKSNNDLTTQARRRKSPFPSLSTDKPPKLRVSGDDISTESTTRKSKRLSQTADRSQPRIDQIRVLSTTTCLSTATRGTGQAGTWFRSSEAHGCPGQIGQS